MNQEEISNEDFLADLRAGSPEAFRKMVEQQKDRVINICYRFVHNRDDADDLAQETFVEIHRSIPGFKGASDLSTWIYQITVSKSLDFIRRQTRQKRGGLLKRLFQSDDDIVEVPAPGSSSPDKILEQKERQQVLRQALNSLPDNQRIAITLSKYDEMSYQEIASVLKVYLSAVESLIHRAKNNLQKKLYNYYKKQS